MGGARRARRQERARNFGERHTLLLAAIIWVLLAGVGAVWVALLIHGAYLGRGWLFGALAGGAANAGIGTAALVSYRRHSRAVNRVLLAWLVPELLSVSAFRFPFPQGSYGHVQAVFNVVHAVLLGYGLVTIAALLVSLPYLALHPDDGVLRPGRPRPAPRRPRQRPGRPAPRHCSGPAPVPRRPGGELAGRARDRQGRHGDLAVPEGRP